MTFVIVGAGPTGVELAGTIAELARDTLSPDFRNIDTQMTRVVLIEAGPRVLAGYPEDLSVYAQRSLEGLGLIVQGLGALSRLHPAEDAPARQRRHDRASGRKDALATDPTRCRPTMRWPADTSLVQTTAGAAGTKLAISLSEYPQGVRGESVLRQKRERKRCGVACQQNVLQVAHCNS